MPSGTSAKRVTRVYSAEQWAEARRLYEEGLSLEGVAEKLGMPYSTIQNHAWTEGWPVRSRGGQRDPRVEAARAKKLARKLKHEEALMIVQTSLAKTEDLEVLACKCLKADSARVKVMMSRVVTRLLSRLEDPTIPVRSAAQALGALAPILRLVFGWSNEPEVHSMKLARKGGDDVPTAAVNLRLIATSPEKLAEMAKAKSDHDDDHDDQSDDHLDDHSGPSTTECNGQGVGPFLCAPEQPPAATQGGPIPKKEAPTGPVKEPVQRWETDLQQAEKANRGDPPCPTAPKAPQNAPKHSVQQASAQVPPPTPGSQTWHRLRIEELARRRAEWLGRR